MAAGSFQPHLQPLLFFEAFLQLLEDFPSETMRVSAVTFEVFTPWMELQHWSEVLISTLGWVGLDIHGASLQNCNEGTWMYWMYFFFRMCWDSGCLFFVGCSAMAGFHGSIITPFRRQTKTIYRGLTTVITQLTNDSSSLLFSPPSGARWAP